MLLRLPLSLSLSLCYHAPCDMQQHQFQQGVKCIYTQLHLQTVRSQQFSVRVGLMMPVYDQQQLTLMMATEVTVVQDSRLRIHMCCVTVRLSVSRDLSAFVFPSTNCYVDCIIRQRILIKLHPNMKRAVAQSAASQRNVSFTL
jgi:hypothetical protein